MRHSKWLVWVVLGVLLFAVTAEAAQEQSGSRIGRFFRGLFKFPAKTTEKSVEVTTDAAKRGAAIGTGAVQNVGEAMTGSKEAAKELVTEPVTEGIMTPVEATKGAVMAPVEGFKEATQE